MRTLRKALCLLAAMGAVCGLAQTVGTRASATKIKVRLFYAHTVQAAEIIPIAASMRKCDTCAAHSMTAPAQISAQNGMVRLAGMAPANAIYIDGGLRVSAADIAQQSSTLHAAAYGRWEISAKGNALRILLVLPSERYVMAALAAESSPDEPMESLKALAIVVRTYALENLHRHAAQGFDLCDSTHCQALRVGPVRGTVQDAVQATLGETLYFGARRAVVYFTQNCGGRSESAQAAWGKAEPYLVSHADPYCVRRGPATWHAAMDAADLLSVLRSNGWHSPAKLTAVRVVQRTASGRAAVIEFSGQGRPLRISASGLRFALDRAMGWQQVRSDGYDVHLEGGKVFFDGNGYGHGVGLCQAGAWQMAATGSDAAAILKFYFPGTVVRVTPHDDGLQRMQGDGWSLITADAAHARAVMAAGDRAWQRAQALFPVRAAATPVVLMMPDTELFRQASGAPGWMLGVTAGSRIWLQPYAIYERNGGVEKVLLHEMLHALVEPAASAKAPLWLREGMVEALAAPQAEGRASQPEGTWLSAAELQQVETMLAHPMTQAESQRAHKEAAGEVKACVARYGFSAVRGWLVSGPPAELARAR